MVTKERTGGYSVAVCSTVSLRRNDEKIAGTGTTAACRVSSPVLSKSLRLVGPIFLPLITYARTHARGLSARLRLRCWPRGLVWDVTFLHISTPLERTSPTFFWMPMMTSTLFISLHVSSDIAEVMDRHLMIYTLYTHLFISRSIELPTGLAHIKP